MEFFDKAISLRPDYKIAFYNRGFSLNNLGKYEEAVESFSKAINI